MDDDRWLEEWLAHCRECWLRLEMLRPVGSASERVTPAQTQEMVEWLRRA